MANISIFLTDGFEEIEALTVVDLCRRADLNIDMVSVTGSLSVTGSHGIAVTADKLIDEVDFDNTDMIVLPGGPGHKALEKCQVLMDQIDAFSAKEKKIAAICAAPSILGRRGILKGHTACCFPSFEDQLLGANVVFDPVVASGHIITARGMGCSVNFGLAIVGSFEGGQVAKDLAKKVVFQ